MVPDVWSGKVSASSVPCPLNCVVWRLCAMAQYALSVRTWGFFTLKGIGSWREPDDQLMRNRIEFAKKIFVSANLKMWKQ